MPRTHLTRFASVLSPAAALLFALALTPAPAVAQESTPVSDYVQSNIDAGITILKDKSLAADARRERIHAFLLALLDTRRIAVFTLGPAGQTASPDQLAAFMDAFRDFMVANYDSRLGGYGGQTLKITGVVQHAPDDFVVRSVLVGPSGIADAQAPEVDLRVVDESGKFYVVDAGIEGIWLAQAQHDDFQGFLKGHNGDVGALTAYLKDITAKIETQSAAN